MVACGEGLARIRAEANVHTRAQQNTWKQSRCLKMGTDEMNYGTATQYNAMWAFKKMIWVRSVMYAAEPPIVQKKRVCVCV